MSVPTPDPVPPKPAPFDWLAGLKSLMPFTGVIACALLVILLIRQRLPDPTPTPLPPPDISLPAEVKIDPAEAVAEIHAEAVGDVTWIVPPGCHVKTRTIDGATLFLVGTKPGVSYVGATALKGGKVLPPVWCKVTVGTPVPPTPPVPPIPPTPPVPPLPPAPIPDAGLHVLVVYETADLGKLPAPQVLILTSDAVRSYLLSKAGRDGWRFYDKDVDTTSDLAWVKGALARPRVSLPWIIVSDGKTGFEGPLPSNVDDTMKLLQKFGG